jgi:putative DNA primase/helicase
MVHGNDEGIWRRIILIPFLVTIPEEDRKPANELQEMFEAEKEGILNWMIEGWKLYQREGLNPPESVKEATQAYREEQDILLDFIRECCDISSTVNRVYAKDLHNAYIKWCDENKETVIKSKSFYLILEEKGFKRQESSHGNKKEFLGISIKSDLF